MNRFKATSKNNNVANNLVGWTIGHHQEGRYKAKNGKIFGEKSLSVEVIGVSFDTLIKIAEELCRAFLQESVVCKSWSSGDVLFINRN